MREKLYLLASSSSADAGNAAAVCCTHGSITSSNLMKYELYRPFLSLCPSLWCYFTWSRLQGPTVLSKEDIERVFALYDRVSVYSVLYSVLSSKS